MTIIPAPGADLATDELLPCPFCGGAAMLDEHPAHSHAGGIAGFMADYPGSFTIECMASKDCNTGQIADTRAEVVTMWNRRASLAAVPASEPVALTEHDLGIIRDIEAMAATPTENWWSQALALGASGLIKRLRAAPAPVSGMPDLASLRKFACNPRGAVGMHCEEGGQWLRVADVERLLNPQAKEDAKK